MESEGIMKQKGETETDKFLEQIHRSKEQLLASQSPPIQNAQAQQGQPGTVPQGVDPAQLTTIRGGQGSYANVQQGAEGGLV